MSKEKILEDEWQVLPRSKPCEILLTATNDPPPRSSISTLILYFYTGEKQRYEIVLTELPKEERIEFLNSLGVDESGLGNLIRATYALLGLRTYFTSGEKETKAWTILSGMTAPQAAGVIHSDFEKGFIRAETVAYDDFVAAGSLASAREKGLLRSEGKDYVVQEGDVMLFRFNV